MIFATAAWWGGCVVRPFTLLVQVLFWLLQPLEIELLAKLKLFVGFEIMVA